MKTSSKAIYLCAASAFALFGATSALAQDSTALEEIVVTGTNIRGVAAVGSPVVSVSRDELKATGLSSTSDISRSLPQVLSLGADESRLAGGQDAAANTTRTAGINLRGVGNEATLLLFNGRRLPPQGVIKAVADPNLIPQAALERLQVVLDGASAVYGADAVAGVVNIITRKNFDGAETTASYGAADGLDKFVFSQTFGKTWGNGSFFAAYEHQERSALKGADRDFQTSDLRAFGDIDRRSTATAPGNILVGSGASALRYPLPAGANRGTLTAAQFGAPVTQAQLNAGAGNRFDEAAYVDILPEQKSDSVYGNLYFDVSDRLQVFAEGFYTKREFSQIVHPINANISVPRANPFYFNPANPLATTPVTVEYRFLNGNGQPRQAGEEETYQIATGFRYDLTEDWQINGSVDYSRNEAWQNRVNVINTPNLTAALNSTNPATAFNAFGSGADNSAALLDSIIANRLTEGTFTNRDAALKIDGPLFGLPGGQVRLAAGVEYHDAEYTQVLTATNVLAGKVPSIKNIANERDYQSAFVELYIPLVGADNAMPLIQRLDLSLAGRYDNYSDFGNTTNPKIGVTWEPGGGLELTASYGTSFRAPSLVDTSGQIRNVFIQQLTDNTSPTGSVQGIFFNGGRPGLQPETAKSFTATVTWTPEFMSGLRINTSYYNIKYEDRIDVLPRTALASSADYGAYIIRNPTVAQVNPFLTDPDLQNAPVPANTILAIVDGRRANLGTLETDGIDFAVNFGWEAWDSQWSVGVNATKILKYEVAAAPGVRPVDLKDTWDNPVSERARFSAGWRRGGLSANGWVNYVGSYRNTTLPAVTKVDNFTTVDASLAYSFPEESNYALRGVRVALSGTNLFDQDPPLALNNVSENGRWTAWDAQNASPVGRMVTLEISKSW